MTTEQILSEIARLQQIQKTNCPCSETWKAASASLQPYFREMQKRTTINQLEELS